jgi:hypothetical protein
VTIAHTIVTLARTGDDVTGESLRRLGYRGRRPMCTNGLISRGNDLLATTGKLVRGWVETDRLGFLQSIGAIPNPPSARRPRRRSRRCSADEGG